MRDSIILKRTNSDNQDFIKLVGQLDDELAVRDGSDHAFYHQFNKIDAIRHTVVAYVNDEAVACGGMKKFDSETMEIKRMFTKIENRGSGISKKILFELEQWAAELSFKKCILETGKKQHEAIGLYKKRGYQLISNYGQYSGIDNSLCFEKKL